MERIVDNPSKLPLELLGMVLSKLDEENLIEELKMCRLVSPRFYKAVQDLFQDQLSQKYCTHFDGSKYNYTKSRTFGMNIFGSYKLNFPTVKISQSEFYLMKSWLGKMIQTNLQTLELKDNLLDWKEIILVLKKFPSIVNLKFIQTSEDMGVAEQILKLFEIKLEPNKGRFEAKIKEQFNEMEIFLPHLKNFEVRIVHIKILNILSFIISCAQCQLESFSIKFDLNGLCKSIRGSLESNVEIQSLVDNEVFMNSLKISSLKHFKKFSKWLKYLDLKILYSGTSRRANHYPEYFGYNILYKSILRIFLKPDKLRMFTNIENLKIKIKSNFDYDYFIDFFDDQHKLGLFEFVKNQKNLQKFAISPFLIAPHGHGQVLKNLMVTPKSTFEYFISDKGFEPILDFSKNLSKLKIRRYPDAHWQYIGPKKRVFRNCTSLEITSLSQNELFEIRNMIEMFPNLKKLDIFFSIVTFTNEDLQLIIKQYKGLKSLKFGNLPRHYNYDSGLTGLSLEAIEARKENPGLPIEPEDRVGVPISHLKNLECLVFKRNYFSPRIRISVSDLSAHHGFDNMPNLKHLYLDNTNITRNGFRTILRKAKSKNLNVYQLNPNRFSLFDDDI